MTCCAMLLRKSLCGLCTCLAPVSTRGVRLHWSLQACILIWPSAQRKIVIEWLCVTSKIAIDGHQVLVGQEARRILGAAISELATLTRNEIRECAPRRLDGLTRRHTLTTLHDVALQPREQLREHFGSNSCLLSLPVCATDWCKRISFTAVG